MWVGLIQSIKGLKSKMEVSQRRKNSCLHQFSSVQSLSLVQLFVTPWIAARQASLSITNSWSSLKFTSIESVMPSSHLILCRPLLLLPSIPPSIRVFFQWVNSSHEVAKVLEFPLWLKAQHSENEDHGIRSHHFMGNRWGNSGNSVRLYFWGLQNHCRWWLQPWN